MISIKLFFLILTLFTSLTSCVNNTKSSFEEEHKPFIPDSESGTPAIQLSFSINPSLLGDTDTALSIQPEVVAQNSMGAIITSFQSAVVLEVYSDINCTTLVSGGIQNATSIAVAGIVAYTGIKILKTNVVAIKAKYGTVQSSCFSGMTISPGSISSLAFSQGFSPVSIVAGIAFSTQPIVQALDANSNVITTDSSSSLSLVAYDGNNCSGSTIASALGGTVTQTLSSGQATFTGISVEKNATKSIRAVMGMVTECSANITVSSTTLSDSNSTISSTTNIAANGTNTATVTITLRDIYNNFITGVTPTISATGSNNTISLCSSSNSSGVSTCTLKSTTAQSKVITITSLAGLTSSATSVFIPGAIASLSYSQAISPLTLTAGVVFSTQPVIQALDANNNVVTSDSTSTVVLEALDANNCGGSTITSGLGGTASKVLSSGVATYTNVATDSELAKSIRASIGSITVCSLNITVSAGAASNNSTIALQAGTADDLTPISVTITLKDTNNNTVPGVTPSYELLDSTGTYTVVTTCPATNSSGVAVCTFKTWRGKERIVRISSPSGLSSVNARASLGCSIISFFNGSEGNGSSGAPYLVSTPKQLDQIRCSGNAYFKIVNDINLTGHDWLTNDYSTSVTIDGNYKTISNLSIDLNITDYAAAGSSLKMASFLDSSSGWSGAFTEIKNLTFTTPRVIAAGKDINNNGTEAATLCGRCLYKFTNIQVTGGVVEGSDDVAGIVIELFTPSGTSPYAELTNSSYRGSVSFIATSATGNKYRWSLAGLIGTVGKSGAIVTGNTFEGRLDSTAITTNNSHVMGGIVGEININEINTTTTPIFENNSVINSTIIGRFSSGGGIVGEVNISRDSQQTTMRKNSVSNTDIENVQTTSNEIGGIIGIIQIANQSDSGSFLNKELLLQKNSVTASSLISLSDYASVGGLVGMGTAINITDNYVNNTDFTTVNNSNNRSIG